MNQALGDLNFIFIYLDDILIFSNTPLEHEEHLRVVLKRLVDHGLRINPSKCELGKSELDFLGHHIDCEGSKPCADKVQAIVDYPKPATVTLLRRFLGIINSFPTHRRPKPLYMHTFMARRKMIKPSSTGPLKRI